MKRLAVVLAMLSMLPLVGCSPVRIKCIVIEGELSTIAVVSASDPRFDQPGVAGAEIVVRQSGRAGDVIIRSTNERGRAHATWDAVPFLPVQPLLLCPLCPMRSPK